MQNSLSPATRLILHAINHSVLADRDKVNNIYSMQLQQYTSSLQSPTLSYRVGRSLWSANRWTTRSKSLESGHALIPGWQILVKVITTASLVFSMHSFSVAGSQSAFKICSPMVKNDSMSESSHQKLQKEIQFFFTFTSLSGLFTNIGLISSHCDVPVVTDELLR